MKVHEAHFIAFFLTFLATCAGDAVMKPAAVAARKQWGKPQMTQIISALGNAKLQTATTAIEGGDEQDALKKAQPAVVIQSPAGSSVSAMGTTVTLQSPSVTVQSPSVSPSLGVTVVKSPTTESPKTVIVTKDKSEEVTEAVSSKGGATITISGKTEDELKKSPVLDTISEGIKEDDISTDNGTVKAKNADDLNLEEVECITEKKGPEASPEKPTPVSPVKAWGEEKATTPTDGRLQTPNSNNRFSCHFKPCQ